MSDATQQTNAMSQQEREQILYKARNTTPLQRVQWLEEMRVLLAPYLGRPERGGERPENDRHLR